VTWHRVLASRVRALFVVRRLDRDLDRELRSHIKMETEANLRRGLSPQEARRAAVREFGGITQTAEQGWSVALSAGECRPFLDEEGIAQRFLQKQTQTTTGTPNSGQTRWHTPQPGFVIRAVFCGITGSFPGPYTLRSGETKRITRLPRAVLGHQPLNRSDVKTCGPYVRFCRNLCGTPRNFNDH